VKQAGSNLPQGTKHPERNSDRDSLSILADHNSVHRPQQGREGEFFRESRERQERRKSELPMSAFSCTP
jgi:hypothetical protein